PCRPVVPQHPRGSAHRPCTPGPWRVLVENLSLRGPEPQQTSSSCRASTRPSQKDGSSPLQLRGPARPQGPVQLSSKYRQSLEMILPTTPPHAAAPESALVILLF